MSDCIQVHCLPIHDSFSAPITLAIHSCLFMPQLQPHNCA